MGRLLKAERMAAWGEMSARSAHMIGNTVFGIKGHLNELQFMLNNARRTRDLPAGRLPPRKFPRPRKHDAN